MGAKEQKNVGQIKYISEGAKDCEVFCQPGVIYAAKKIHN